MALPEGMREKKKRVRPCGRVIPVCCSGTIRNAPSGTVISKRAPFPGSPFSVMVTPVIERISRERKRP